ncbi:hypothetical protein [Lactovum odontotermitis]
MKKLLKIVLVAFLAVMAALTLTACKSSSNSNVSAKKAFISDYAALSKSNGNVQELSVSVDKVKATGDGAEAVNQLAGAKAAFSVNTDTKDKTASASVTINAVGMNLKLNLLMVKAGIYIPGDDIKKLYNDRALHSLLTSDDAATEEVYDAMITGLTAPYLSLDADLLHQLMSSRTSSNGLSWENMIDEMFNASSKQALSEADLTKALSKVPNSDFTQSSGKTTIKLPVGSSSFNDFFTGVASSNASLTKAQTEQILKTISDSGVDLKKMTAEITLDREKRELTMVISGKVTSQNNQTLDFGMTINSKSSNSSKKVTIPAANKVQTFEDVRDAAISILMGGQSS